MTKLPSELCEKLGVLSGEEKTLKLKEKTSIMDLDGLMRYNALKAGVEETFPFDEEVLVFKVMGKMFAATSIVDQPFRVNLKCDPEWAMELRDEHAEIIPGWHMNKKHWNTVIIGEGTLEQSLILKMIDHSYNLVVKSLTKAKKLELEELKKANG